MRPADHRAFLSFAGPSGLLPGLFPVGENCTSDERLAPHAEQLYPVQASPTLLPQEYQFLKRNLCQPIKADDPDMLGRVYGHAEGFRVNQRRPGNTRRDGVLRLPQFNIPDEIRSPHDVQKWIPRPKSEGDFRSRRHQIQ